VEEMRSPSKGVRVSEGRALAAWVVLNLCDGTLTELGRNVGRDVTTLSSAVKRLISRSKKDGEIAARIDSVREAAIEFARLQS
jgi:putative transposase